MLNCSDFLQSYSEFRDGHLGPARRLAFEAHLRGCPSCARYDRVVDQGVGLLHQLEVEPSHDFLPRLQHRLYHVDEEARQRGQRSYGASVGLMLAIAGALAALAWMPVLEREAEPLALPAVAAHAPHRDLGAPALFRASSLLLAPPAEEPLVLPAAKTLFTRYAPLGAPPLPAARLVGSSVP